MPRLRRKGHRVKVDGHAHSREELLQKLNGWGLLNPERVLVGIPEEEAADILAEAKQIYWEKRTAELDPILRERLRAWPVNAWGSIFCSAPYLEDELSPQQRAAWEEWRKQASAHLALSGGDRATTQA